MTAHIEEVRSYWEAHPLCASVNPHPLGSREYFRYYDVLREANESVEFSHVLHEYDSFRGQRVLDVGAGNGYVLSRYAQGGAITYGIDITRTGIDLCWQRFRYLGLRGHFAVANAEELPFEDESFDCVCSMGVLHHTPDASRAVSEIRRVLRHGGRLIVMVYHRNSAWYRMGLPLAGLLTGKGRRQLVNEIDGAGNPKGEVYSKAELARLLAGFSSLEMSAGLLRGYMILPRLGALIPDPLVRFLQRRIGWFLYAKGHKV